MRSDHCALSMLTGLEYETLNQKDCRGTLDIQWRCVSTRLHNATEKNRDIRDIAVFKNW